MEKPTKYVPNRLLYNARKAKGWSQSTLAEKVVSTTVNVSRWERGITAPGPHLTHELCKVFGKSASELGLGVKKTSEVVETPISLWNVPYTRNSFFTACEEVLDQLHTALIAQMQPMMIGQPQAISGLGGVGKTQLAIEYAYRYRATYQAVFWVRAESADLLVSDFLAIATLFNLPVSQEPKQGEVVEAV